MENKLIIVKEIDKLSSKMHKGKIVKEFLVYYSVNSVLVDAFTIFGDNEKNLKTNELISKYSLTENDIQYVSFDEYKKQIKQKIKKK